MGKYNIEVLGEIAHDFMIELSQDELRGVLKLLTRCNETSDYNDKFIVTDVKTNEELLSY